MAQPRLPETTDKLGVSQVAGGVSLQLPSPLPSLFSPGPLVFLRAEGTTGSLRLVASWAPSCEMAWLATDTLHLCHVKSEPRGVRWFRPPVHI